MSDVVKITPAVFTFQEVSVCRSTWEPKSIAAERGLGGGGGDISAFKDLNQRVCFFHGTLSHVVISRGTLTCELATVRVRAGLILTDKHKNTTRSARDLSHFEQNMCVCEFSIPPRI